MNARIVIAGTDEQLLSELQMNLLNAGFEAVSVTNGLDCLFALRRAVPCVLVLDLDGELTRGSGENVIAMMRDDPGVSAVRVLLLTSSSSFASGKSWRIAEHAVMSKPVKPTELTIVARELSQFRPSSPIHTSAPALNSTFD
jgi:DNA-binding response OmpR family regulator